MTFSLVLDVIVGMVFTYFLLAAIVSGVQEVVAGWLSWRGAYLSKGIDVIIDNDPSAMWSWGKDFWAAHKGKAVPTAVDRLKAQIGNAAPLPEQEALLQVLNVHTHPLIRGTPTNLPSYVSSRNFALALLETLRDGSQSALITQVETTISKLPPGDLKRTLSLFLQNAGGDLDKFRASIETWFDDAMDRVSGIYKRFSQYVLLILGLAIALILNINSIQLARVLWQEDGIRNAIVADATVAASHPSPAMQAAAKGPTAPATAATAGQLPGTSSPKQDASTTASVPLPPIEEEMTDFENANVPFGWSNPPSGWGWVGAVCGWVITALAVALGAPFWFGLLQQLTNLRNAGPSPKRADAPS